MQKGRKKISKLPYQERLKIKLTNREQQVKEKTTGKPN